MQSFCFFSIILKNISKNMTKEELVDLCAKGDEQALSLLYKLYADKMRRICFQYVSDEQIVKDLLHDGFIIIFTSISMLRSPEKLESWMGKIMKNISLRYLEQCRSITTVSLNSIEEYEEPLVPLSHSNDFPSYTLLLKMIESLPEGYGKIFKLAVLEGLSHKEIGLLLNIAPHSSSSQLSRAKDMLRKLLASYRTLIGLLILLSIISLRILLLDTPKNNAVTEPRITVGQKKEEQEPGNILPEDSINAALIYTPAPQYVYSESIKKEMPEQETIQEDSVVERKDSSPSVNGQMIENQNIRRDDKLHCTTIPKRLFNDKKSWSLALSYSGGEKRTGIQKSIISSDILIGPPQEVLKKSYHHIPITLSLSLRKKINEYWGIETGIQYTHLRSDSTIISDSHWEEIQKCNYIGIPLKGTFNIWNGAKFSVYTSAGVTLDIPVRVTSEEFLRENGEITSQKKKNLSLPLQWSTNFGIGVQYQITPSIGIYAEPNLHYYFNKGNRIKTIRTEKPFDVTIPIGVRLSW